MERMRDMCKNITLPQTSFTGGMSIRHTFRWLAVGGMMPVLSFKDPQRRRGVASAVKYFMSIDIFT